jgi:murein L,D-transpeptidase YcbB/YkuD
MLKKLSFFIFLGTLFATFVSALPHPAQDPRVQKVYEHLQDKLAWIQDESWTACGKTLLDIFSRVEEDGLWPEEYTPFVEALQEADLSTPEAQKAADALLTLVALNYIADMKGKRLDPHAAAKDIYIKQNPIDEAEVLKTYLSLSPSCEWVDTLAPTFPEYQHLKHLLSLYRQKQAQGGWPQLPKGTKLQKGDQGPLVETLRSQLIAQEALASEGQGSDIFDEALEEALKDLHGLEKDGKVGESTLTALNTSVEDRIQSIIVSLERQRWFPNPLPSRYVQVNVPGFYLKAVEGTTPAFFMPIITGQEHKKTPIFNASMTEITFNPAWHVPASIVTEILPKLRRNPDAYVRRGYHLYNNAGSLRIVQSPGNGNALGKIRFTLESPYSIYLHGTPNEKLFQKHKRSLSHGCIRVQDPYKLAEFVFQDPQKWPFFRIKAEALGTKTKRVKLDSSLPVFVTYFTVFEDENKNMHFVEDAYHQDKKVWFALEKAKKRIKTED